MSEIAFVGQTVDVVWVGGEMGELMCGGLVALLAPQRISLQKRQFGTRKWSIERLALTKSAEIQSPLSNPSTRSSAVTYRKQG
jgi:hypothetical protein